MSAPDPTAPSASDVERLGPWGALAADAESTPSPDPAPAPQSPRSLASELGWGLVSTAALALFLGLQWGWVRAAAGVLGVFVHEFGHLAAINGLGCGPGRIQIIPFFGGAASMRRAPDTEFKSVLIALAGPIAGLAAAIPFWGLYVVTRDARWLQGVVFIGGLNLLNLLPAPPLDGAKALGPALAWIHPTVERGAMMFLGGIGVYLAVRFGQPLIAAFVGIGAAQAVLGRVPRAPAKRMSILQWLAALVLWAGAFVLCATVTYAAWPRQA
ncbi:peptidase M50 [Phenylobacterium montanum]|uniref:Peptidase M50 n=1 Tax=Phenylobacterium montanum TaxID=2823693 RepID=A0A975IXZ7_9CAUL|nr:peptidase M50 [Caulobacter sp. S6]QUD89941.1 peptidase M50 [Caulobacter sp. S6]